MSNIARYFNLSIPAPKRLALMREDFATHAARYPYCPEHAKPKTWRDIRGTTHKSVHAYCGGLDQGFNGTDGHKTPVWYCHTGPQFRGERFADDCDRGPSHQGWFSDTDYCEKVRGIVGRLTHGRFIAGYHWSNNGERVYFPEVFGDEGEAANMADEHARAYAETCMEDSQMQDAVRNLETEIEDSFQRLRECLVLRHKACMHYVRDEISELIETIRDKRNTLKNDFTDYAY